MSVMGKFNKILDNSGDGPSELDAWPYIEKTSNTSDLPIFEPVPLVDRFGLNALVIVLPETAMYLLIAMIT